MSREHLSFSALRQLQTCGLQYRLQRLDGVAPAFRSGSLVLGRAYHGTIASALVGLVKEKGVTKEAMAAWFDEAYDAELAAREPPVRWAGRTTADSERELGRRMVEAWYEQGLGFFVQAEEIVAVELPFIVAIQHSDGRVLDLPLEGVTDAIVRLPDGRHVVVDHKTSRSAYTANGIELDLQSTCYSYSARQLGYEGAGFQFQVMGKSRKSPKLAVVNVTRDEDGFDRLYWICANALRLIESGIYLPAAPGWQCNACEYRRACVTAHRDADRPAQVAGTVGSVRKGVSA